ncbi:hypothetical protein AAVH_18962, partial [Aphelenchoides avenae]
NNSKYVHYWLYWEVGSTPPFNPNATIICQATFKGFGKPPMNISHDYDKVWQLSYVGAAQVALIELLCIGIAVATFATLHFNRQYFSKDFNITYIRIELIEP